MPIPDTIPILGIPWDDVLFVILGDTLRATPSVHPELLVWFPNVLFGVLGIFLFRRLARQ